MITRQLDLVRQRNGLYVNPDVEFPIHWVSLKEAHEIPESRRNDPAAPQESLALSEDRYERRRVQRLRMMNGN